MTRPTILITGAAGQLAKTVAARLSSQAELIGADVRPLAPGDRFPGEFHQVRYTQRKMDDLFRRHRPEVLVHLGRIRGTEEASLNQRYTQNVLGTRRLLELCLRHGTRRAVVLSTFHVYGAHQHNHVHIREDEPLRASQIFPELSDAVELDHAATSFLWRYRRVETVVLRPANIIGPALNNMISRLLRARACPLLLGYDPMMQFVHEVDTARAIQLVVDKGGWGVFNVAGEGAVPWSHAIRLAQAEPIPVPHFIAYPLVGLLARWRLLFPKHLIDYFRYPVVIDDELFRGEYGYAPSMTTVDALRSVGESEAPPATAAPAAASAPG